MSQATYRPPARPPLHFLHSTLTTTRHTTTLFPSLLSRKNQLARAHTHTSLPTPAMSASPEFYKPAPPAFSPCSSPLLLHGAGVAVGAVAEESTAAAATVSQDEEEDYRCRTPTGGESQVKPPGTCPPAPRKPRAPAACRKRLFEVEVLSLRLEELEQLFWRPRPAPPPPPPAQKKKRRRVACTGPNKKSI